MKTHILLFLLLAYLGAVWAQPTFKFASKRMFNEEFTQPQNDNLMFIGSRVKIPFKAPTTHPFETVQELNRVRALDPYSFTTKHYSRSETALKRMIQQDSHSNLKRSIKKLMVEGIDYMSLNEHTNYIQDGSLHTYTYDANILTGVVFLDMEESVWDVKCSGTGIQVDFSNGHFTARQWIPGTRLVIGKKWNCFGSSTLDVYGKEEQLAFLVYSRSILGEEDNMLKINFNVKSLANNELFFSGQLSYKSSPIMRQTDGNLTSILTTSQQHKAARYSYTKKLNILGFNYDVKTTSVKESKITLYAKDGFKVTCENCYVCLNAEIKVECEWSYLKITDAKLLFGGAFELDATLKASLSKEFTISKKGVLGSLGPSKFFFFYGLIWVEYNPSLAYSIGVKALTSLEYSRNFQVSYEKLFGFQYTSANGFDYAIGGDGFKWSSSSPGLRIAAGSVEAEFSLYPEVEFSVWSLSKCKVAVIPYLIFDISLEGLASSLSDYKLCAKVETSYKVDISFVNEYWEIDKTFTIFEKSPIAYLSGSYSLQSPSYNAVESNSIYSTGNEVPSLSSVSDVSNFKIIVSIAPSSDYYYIKYGQSDTTNPPPITTTTDTFYCKNGCTFNFSPSKFFALKIYTDGYIYDTLELNKNLAFSPYPPTSTTTVFSQGIFTVKLQMDGIGRSVTFKDKPSNEFKITTTTSFNFESSSFQPNRFVSFKSDCLLGSYLTSDKFQYVYENGFYYYYSQDSDPSFMILGLSGATITFENAVSYLMVNPNSLTTTNAIMRDSKSLNNFIQIINQSAARYVVTLQTKGSFDILVYEAWIVNYKIFQTKGKKFQYIETSTGDLESLPLRTHQFTISLENSYGDIKQGHIIVAQIIPIDATSVSTIRFDPYSTLTSDSTFSTSVMIEQEVPQNSMYPYLAVSSSTTTMSVSLTNSMIEGVSMSSGLYTVTQSSNSIIPIPTNFEKFYLSPDRNILDTLKVNLLQNFKLMNGIPSIVKKLVKDEVGSFAIPCNGTMNWLKTYMRVIDPNSGNIISNIQITASLLTKSAISLSTIDLVTVSDGSFYISNMDVVNSICKTDSENRYIQLSIKNTNTEPCARQLEVYQTLDYSKVNTRAIGELTIDSSVSGNVYIDVANEKNKYSLGGSKGLVFIATTLEDCNLDFYINKKGQISAPSFSDPSSIFASSSSSSVKGEKMSVSLMSDHGSIIMIYSDKKCRFTMTTQELKTTQLSLKFVTNGQSTISQATFSSNETTLIHVTILDENHSWDQNFTISLRSSSNPLDLFGMDSSKLSNFFSSANVVLLNRQTLAIELVPKPNAQFNTLQKSTISFKADSSMFDSRYDIQPSNILTVGTEPQPIQPVLSIINNSTHPVQPISEGSSVKSSILFYAILLVIVLIY